MRINTIKYYIKESLKSVYRNRIMSLASITTVAATLFILGVFMALAINVNRFAANVEDMIEITAFLKDDVTTLKQQELERQIREIQGVVSVEYESKEKALEKFKEQLGENKDLAKGLEESNPLPASFIIKVDSPDSVEYVSPRIAQLEGVLKVKDAKKTVQTIGKLVKIVRYSSTVLMIILGTISIFLISNTIKLTVFARKREISIMKYIGATDWFIRWPFILEGLLLGLIGGFIAALIVENAYTYAANAIKHNIMIFTLVPPQEAVKQFWWQFSLLGTLIGGFGSYISIRRFLSV
ncbi:MULTISPECIES: permease-like cell division protein FtsX [Caloramator]|uniref:Cell division protein FtsX n=1 Tax=Caloramator proteoclasticus DSM 10124 TaxID=1121262 RepID=A0A1M4WMZ8_9CLOT|nr:MULTISPECIES: permease-like cell division protein FtsX [Caloramator]SHE82584.1 cell division protein FtsX [Caloramator proteoclasticus DSM 10124]